MTVFKPLIIEHIAKGSVAENGIFILIEGNRTALWCKWIKHTAVKNAFHLAGAIKGAVLKIALIESTVRQNRLVERHASELAVCNPYGVNISTGEGAVAERAARETRTFQIRIVKSNFIKNALNKNGTVE